VTLKRALTVSCVIVAAGGLSGCLAFNAASMVAGAAVGTVTAVGRAVVGAAASTSRAISSASESTARAVSRTVTQIPARMMYGPRPVRQVATPQRMVPRSTRTSTKPTTTTPTKPTQNRKPAKPSSKERQALLEVLPPEVLDQMTKDELILQAMIQLEALTSDKDEVIFWDLEGHAGTASAEKEHRMGTFVCRTITETIKLDTTEDAQALQSKATACRTDDVGWSLSF
jgi:surface antigen